jgi:hypothetical protein
MERKASTTTWPEHYPEKCPPDTATDVSGEVYRFTSKTNPKHKDFLSYYELKPNNDWGKMECQARGLSVYTTKEDCRAAIDTIPALRKKYLCVAELHGEAGVIAETPSQNSNNHKTLWSLFSAEELANLFKSIELTRVSHV